MYKNILFDLDGTLTDSAEGITRCVQYALAAQGIDEPDLSKLLVFVGPPLRVSFQKYYGWTPEQAEAGLWKYRERYERVGIWENKLYPGILELCRDLKAAGYRLGIATGKPEPHARRIAEQFGLLPYLDEINGTALDGSFDSKIIVMENSLKRWNISTDEEKNETILIGDRDQDAISSHHVGIKCMGIRWGFAKSGELEQAGADIILDTVEDVRSFFLK